jgi:hypothetical protein
MTLAAIADKVVATHINLLNADRRRYEAAEPESGLSVSRCSAHRWTAHVSAYSRPMSSAALRSAAVRARV